MLVGRIVSPDSFTHRYEHTNTVAVDNFTMAETQFFTEHV